MSNAQKPISGKQYIMIFDLHGTESPPVRVNLKAWFADKCWLSYAINNEVEPFNFDNNGEFVINARDIMKYFEIGEIPDEEIDYD